MSPRGSLAGRFEVQQIAGEYASTIKLNNQDGSQIESGLSLEFRNALVEQLK